MRKTFFMTVLCLFLFNTVLAQSDLEQMYRPLIERGEELKRAGEYENALDCFDEAIRLLDADLADDDTLNYSNAHLYWFVGLDYCDMGSFSQDDKYYAKALNAFAKEAEIAKRYEGERSEYYADAIHYMGKAYYDLGDCRNAVTCFETELDILLDSIDEYDPELDYLYEKMATCYVVLEDYANAVVLLERRMVILKSGEGDEFDIIEVLDLLGESYDGLGQFNKARDTYGTLIKLYSSEYGENDEDFGHYLDYYANCCMNLSLYEEAKDGFAQAIAVMESLGDERLYKYTITMMTGMSLCLYHLKQYEDVVYWLDRKNSTLQKIKVDSTLSNDELSLKALCFYEMKDYERSVAIYLQVLDKENKGSDDLSRLFTIYNIASCYTKLENNRMAIQYYEKALPLLRNTGERETVDVEYIACLRKIGASYCSLGEYDQAINYLTSALGLAEDILGNQSDECAFLLNHLGMCYIGTKELDKSIDVLSKALAIMKDASIYNNLGEVYDEMGDYQKAVDCLDKALEMALQDMENEDNKSTYATAILNLGSIYMSSMEYDKAIACFEEAYRVNTELYGKKRSTIATSLNNLSVAYGQIGNLEKSLEYGRKALEILHDLHGDVHPHIASTLDNMGTVYLDMKDYEQAEGWLLRALDMDIKCFGENHPFQYATVYYHLGLVYQGLGRKKEMSENFIRYSQLIKEEVLEKFSYMSHLERTLYWYKYDWFFTRNMPSYADILQDDEKFVCATYDGLLFSKGLLLNAEIEVRNMILDSGDVESLDLFNQLQNCKRQLLKVYEKPIAERGADVDSLENLANSIEKELQRRCASYGDLTRNMNVDWKQVQSNLRDGEIAIEFMEVPLRNDSTFYCALTLKKDYEAPHFVELFAAFETRDHDLYDLVWKPLETELAGMKTVYFSAAGELYRLPIEYADKGQWTLNEHLDLFRLSSTRQIAVDYEKRTVTSAVVYGGLVYDSGKHGHLAEARGHVVTDYSVGYLQGTLTESKVISQLLEEAQIETNLVVGEEGTESSFKALSGKGVDVIHVATHGFYWTEEEAENAGEILRRNELMLDGGFVQARSQENYDLSRSALLFSGANEALNEDYRHRDGIEDGILTAKEISNLNLRGADLVVLSACQTGLGKISGEGVSGLQRGLKMAGVKTILMSLWNVDDRATQILMVEFYRNYVAGKSKLESLKTAQKTVKDTPGFGDFRYWASFVLLDGDD